MGLTTTTTNLSYARNELIKAGVSWVFDKVGDMIYYMLANNDVTGTGPHLITHTHTLTSGTASSFRINNYPTMVSGCSSRGLMVLSEALAGSGGVNLIGITAIAEMDSTKRSTGFMTAGTFSLINAANAMAGMGCIELTWKNTATAPSVPGGQNWAYIILRDYGTLPICSLFTLPDHVTEMGTEADSALVSTLVETASSHGIRFMVGTVPYWIMCTSAAPTAAS